MNDPLTKQVSELITQNPEAKPYQIADAVFERINATTDVRDLFYPTVVREVKRQHRDETKDYERAAFKTKPMTEGGGHKPVDPLAARKEVMRRGFWNGTEYVNWDAATIEDHEGAIEHARRIISGYEETIFVHQKAIEELQAAGVNSYAELAEQKAA